MWIEYCYIWPAIFYPWKMYPLQKIKCQANDSANGTSPEKSHDGLQTSLFVLGHGSFWASVCEAWKRHGETLVLLEYPHRSPRVSSVNGHGWLTVDRTLLERNKSWEKGLKSRTSNRLIVGCFSEGVSGSSSQLPQVCQEFGSFLCAVLRLSWRQSSRHK